MWHTYDQRMYMEFIYVYMSFRTCVILSCAENLKEKLQASLDAKYLYGHHLMQQGGRGIGTKIKLSSHVHEYRSHWCVMTVSQVNWLDDDIDPCHDLYYVLPAALAAVSLETKKSTPDQHGSTSTDSTWIGTGSRNHMPSWWPEWLYRRQSSARSLTALSPSPTTSRAVITHLKLRLTIQMIQLARFFRNHFRQTNNIPIVNLDFR